MFMLLCPSMKFNQESVLWKKNAQDPGASSPKEVPGPSNQTEVHNATVDFQDPGASNQSEVPTNTVGSQDPGASNQTGEQTATVDLSEPGPINQTEVPNVGTTDYSSPQNVPDIEYPVHDISPGNISPFPEHVATEPVESVDQIFSNEKEIHSPIVDSGEHSFEFQQHSEAPPSAISHEVPEMSFASLQFAIQSTTPLLQQNPRRRKRVF